MLLRLFAFGSPAIPVPCFLPIFLVDGKYTMVFSLGAHTYNFLKTSTQVKSLW